MPVSSGYSWNQQTYRRSFSGNRARFNGSRFHSFPQLCSCDFLLRQLVSEPCSLLEKMPPRREGNRRRVIVDEIYYHNDLDRRIEQMVEDRVDAVVKQRLDVVVE